MSLKSFMVSTLFAGATLTGYAQTKNITKVDIESAFRSAIEQKKLPVQPYVGMNENKKVYDDCMAYDFIVHGKKLSLYYCFSKPQNVVFSDMYDFNSRNIEEKRLLYETLQSSQPLLKQ